MSNSQDSESSPASISPPGELVKQDIQSSDIQDPEKVEYVSEQLRLEDHENPLNWKNGRKCTVLSLPKKQKTIVESLYLITWLR